MYVIFHIIRFILSCSIAGSWLLGWNMLEEWRVRHRSLFKVNFCGCIWGTGGVSVQVWISLFTDSEKLLCWEMFRSFQIALSTLLISSFGGRLSLSLHCQELLAPSLRGFKHWKLILNFQVGKKSSQKHLFLQSLQRKIVRPGTSQLLVLAQIFLALALSFAFVLNNWCGSNIDEVEHYHH